VNNIYTVRQTADSPTAIRRFWQDMRLELCVDCVNVLITGNSDSLLPDYPLERVLAEWSGWYVDFHVDAPQDGVFEDGYEHDTAKHFSNQRCAECRGLAGDRWDCLATREVSPAEAFALQA
jgi:hypothetical protein